MTAADLRQSIDRDESLLDQWRGELALVLSVVEDLKADIDETQRRRDANQDRWYSLLHREARQPNKRRAGKNGRK